MKKRIKDIIIGILIGCILMTTTPVLANSIIQKIDVALNTVKVEVNGEKLDADNILYRGTTYLPMRKVAEAVGKDVNWDQTTMTANIVEKENEVNNCMSELNYTQEEYQEFKNMFVYKNTHKSSDNTIDLMVYEYAGSLNLNELKTYLKNKSNRNELLKAMMSEVYNNESSNLTLQFIYKNEDDSYIFIGYIANKSNGNQIISFENCD